MKTFEIRCNKKDKLKIYPVKKKVKSKSKNVQKGRKKSSKRKRKKSSKMKTQKSKGSETFSAGVGDSAISQTARKRRGIKFYIVFHSCKKLLLFFSVLLVGQKTINISVNIFMS